MTLEELRQVLAEGYNYSAERAADIDLTIDQRTYQAGRASALIQVLGQLDKIISEKVGA